MSSAPESILGNGNDWLGWTFWSISAGGKSCFAALWRNTNLTSQLWGIYRLGERGLICILHTLFTMKALILSTLLLAAACNAHSIFQVSFGSLGSIPLSDCGTRESLSMVQTRATSLVSVLPIRTTCVLFMYTPTVS